MPAPINKIKAALMRDEVQTGLWLNIASTTVAEIAAGAGFDWCLIDAEHGPNTVATILPQLQALESRGTSAVVRVPIGADWLIKQVLDVGAQTVLVPMVETAEQARDMVRAMRYPPQGTRGMGAALARASHYSGITDYVATANEQVCMIAQVESCKALDNLEAIAAVEGVDCVFIGPADLAADMGYATDTDAPEVLAAVDDAIRRIRAAGKVAGIITFTPQRVARYAQLGVRFLGVGSDVITLAQAVRGLNNTVRDLLGGAEV